MTIYAVEVSNMHVCGEVLGICKCICSELCYAAGDGATLMKQFFKGINKKWGVHILAKRCVGQVFVGVGVGLG